MDLIRRCQAGDEQAFAELFRRYKNLVYKTAYLMLGDADEAEDVLQEVFVQVYKSLDAYDPGRGAFTTWLYRITVNRCLNWRRRWRPFVSLDRARTSVPSPEGRMEEKAVWQAVRGLSEKLRAVVILRYYWELSYAEIAQILDIPLGTVKSRLNLALRTLRKELEAEEASAKTRLSQQEV